MKRFSKAFFIAATVFTLSVAATAAEHEALVLQGEKKAMSVTTPASFELVFEGFCLFGGVSVPRTSTEQERSIARKRAQAMAWRQLAARAVQNTALALLESSDRLVALLETLPLWNSSTTKLATLPHQRGVGADGRLWSLLVLPDSQVEELHRSLQKGILESDVARLMMLDQIGLAYEARNAGDFTTARIHFERAFSHRSEPQTDVVIDYCRILASQGEKDGALRILDGLWNQRRHAMIAQQKQQFFELRDKILAQ